MTVAVEQAGSDFPELTELSQDGAVELAVVTNPNETEAWLPGQSPAAAAETSVNITEDITETDQPLGDLDEVAAPLDLVRVYLNGIGKVALLNAAEEVELAKRIEAGLYADHLLNTSDDLKLGYKRELREVAIDGQRAKDHMLRANTRLVVSMAKRYTGHGMDFLDLIQEGNDGLIRAVEKYDYTKGFKFSTYATWWIRQAITRGMADKARTIRIPVHTVEEINKMQRLQKELLQETGRKATPAELADKLDMTEGHVQKLILYSREPLSLDMSVGEDDGATLGDFITDNRPVADAAAQAEQAELSRKMSEVIKTLGPREAAVVRMRYGLDGTQAMTLIEIGKRLRLSTERIRQIEREAMAKLRRPSRAQVLREFVEG